MQHETGFYFVDSSQGAREEAPADIERANVDAQVTHFNAHCGLLHWCVLKHERNELFVYANSH